MSKNLTQKTLSGFLWMASSSFLKAILRLIVVGILARLLVPKDFGVVAAAMVVILFTEMIYEMGVGPALVQLEDLTPAHIQTAFTFSVTLGIGLALLFYLINPYIATFYGMPRLTEVLNILVWIFPVRTFSQISYSLLQRDMRFKRLAGLDVISYFFGYGVLGIGGALYGMGLYALVWANLGEGILYSLILYFLMKPSLKPMLDKAALRQLLNFGSGFTLASLLNFGARKADYLIVGKYLGSGALGIYSRGYSLMNAPNNVVGKIMNKVLFATFSKIQTKEKKIKKYLIHSYGVIFITVMPLGVFCYFTAREIVLILLGKQWLEVIPVFKILVVGMLFRIAYKLGGSYLKGTGNVKALSIVQGVYFLMIVVFTIIGVQYSITTVAGGVTLAIMLNFLIVTVLITKFSQLPINELVRAVAPSFLSSFCLACLLFFLVQPLRDMNISPVMILLLCGVISIAVLGMGGWFFPKMFLGTGGSWLLKRVGLDKYCN